MTTGGLKVADVTVTFGGLTALNHVSMEVAPSEVVGVIGPNGAGKTTLFNVVCGFVRPVSGRLEFAGRPLSRHHPHDLAALGIGRTVQGVGLWPGLTVLENVTAGADVTARTGLTAALLGLPRAEHDESDLRDRAIAVLDELRIDQYAGQFPATLPYAIQKRVALARALVSDPVLLLLDEPASGLSEAEMGEFGRLVGRLRERMGVVLVEHHMDLVMTVCDRVIVLDFGQVIADGPPETVKADPAVTRAYLGEDASTVPAAFPPDVPSASGAGADA
jgi:branched-chain amino acid transport system ATP-binding protein